MQFHKAYYSVIQYCPDRGRAEAANIGVLVLCPDLGFVDAKTSRNHERVRRFFGGSTFDAARLQLMKRAIETRVRSKFDFSEGLADLDRFIATRANDIQLTPPRALKTADPRADLEKLFAELVVDESEKRRQPQPPAFRELRSALRAPGIRERVLFDERIQIPVLDKEVVVPYVYRNGALNLVKPQVFRGSATSVARDAAELAVEGDLLQRHAEEPKRQLIVIPAFSSEDAASAKDRVEGLFAEYDIRVVEENAVSAFIAEIDANAH